jgi:hypothetical protein
MDRVQELVEEGLQVRDWRPSRVHVFARYGVRRNPSLAFIWVKGNGTGRAMVSACELDNFALQGVGANDCVLNTLCQ